MTTFQQLENHLKTKVNNKLIAYELPQIRYFDGTNSFSDQNGWYRADTLEESLKLYLESINKFNNLFK